VDATVSSDELMIALCILCESLHWISKVSASGSFFVNFAMIVMSSGDCVVGWLRRVIRLEFSSKMPWMGILGIQN
jgi:hypothetical protein